MVDGQLAANDERQIVSDLDQARVQALERGELRRDARAEGAELMWGFDVPEQMLDANFLGFFGFDR